MAYNNKFISIKAIIESAYRDSGAEEIPFETAIEDAAELVGLIGIPYTYIEKTTDGSIAPLIKVEDYRTFLPEDLVSLVSMRKAILDANGNISNSYPMVESADVYQYSRMGTDFPSNYITPGSPMPIMELNQDGSLKVEDGIVVGETIRPVSTTAYNYKINNNVLYTDFELGYIVMTYNAFPIDEEGFLMIPDDEKFRNALKYHLIMKHDYRRWRAFPEKPGLKALLNDSEQKRDFYVGAARNKAHIPSIDKMESIKNMMLRSIPKINEHQTGFRTLNKQEQRKF